MNNYFIINFNIELLLNFFEFEILKKLMIEG